MNTLYRQAYFEDNGSYPEIVETEFLIDGNGTELKCVLPCSGSSECNCLSGWSVSRMNDVSEVRFKFYVRIYMTCVCAGFCRKRYLQLQNQPYEIFIQV